MESGKSQRKTQKTEEKSASNEVQVKKKKRKKENFNAGDKLNGNGLLLFFFTDIARRMKSS